uniref:Inversin n=1 Tax=Eptatretus burgeri TaxID=7764 RepID=A0A8C4WZY8_EPTBU
MSAPDHILQRRPLTQRRDCASPSLPCLYLSSPVHSAVVNGQKALLQRLITDDPRLGNWPDQFGRTPLMYCVLADRQECAELLVKARVDVEKADKNQRTALHFAAKKPSNPHSAR